MLDKHPEPNMDKVTDNTVKRAVALVIDNIIIIGLVILGFIVGFGITATTGSTTLGLIGVGLGVLLGQVYVIYTEAKYGQTIGKSAMDLVVVREDGSAASLGPAIIRYLLVPIDYFPVFYFVGIVSMILSDNDQRVGDRLAGTVVANVAQSQHGTIDESWGDSERDDRSDLTVD